MTASIAMTNYFHSLRQTEDFSFEIVMDNARTFRSASTPEVMVTQEEDPVSKAERRWSQSLDLSALAPGLVSISCNNAPFIPKRKLSMDVLDDGEEERTSERKKDAHHSPVQTRPRTSRTSRRKTLLKKSKMAE